MNRTWSAEEENELRILYDNGYLASHIAIILNLKYHNAINKRNKMQVRQKACRMGGIKSKFCQKEIDGLYYCSHCKSYKNKNEFRSNKSNKNEIGNLCKPCESVYKKRYRRNVKLLDGITDDYKRESEMESILFEDLKKSLKQLNDSGVMNYLMMFEAVVYDKLILGNLFIELLRIDRNIGKFLIENEMQAIDVYKIEQALIELLEKEGK